MKHSFFARATLHGALLSPSLKTGLALFCIVFLCFFIAGLGYGMGSAPGKDAGRPATPPVPVLADTAKKSDYPVYFQGLGTATAINTVTVRSRVDGELIKQHFTEGQEVAEGDLLAEIDPRPYKAELTQAEGQLLRDQALLRNAKQDLARYKVLLPQDSATPQQVDLQEALVRQHEAAVKVDTGKIEAVRLQLAYCRITAPVSGRLGLKLVDRGNMVRASDTTGIVVITQVRPISVLFTVTEGQLPRVLQGMRQGTKLPVEAWDRTRSTLLTTGTLLTTDNRIDTTTGTVKLKAVFDNADYALFPNQFVNAKILVDTLKDVVLVPTAAVQHATRGAFVYVVEKGVATLRGVTIGEGNNTVTVITDGVSPGDVLVIDGLDRLRDQSPVVATFPDGTKAGSGKSDLQSPSGGNDKRGRDTGSASGKP